MSFGGETGVVVKTTCKESSYKLCHKIEPLFEGVGHENEFILEGFVFKVEMNAWGHWS